MVPRIAACRWRPQGAKASARKPAGSLVNLNALACPQTHLFEDRVMKVDHVIIGKRVYMGPRSAVLYGAVVADNAKLGALTLVMKGEFIPAASSWKGCPAAPARN